MKRGSTAAWRLGVAITCLCMAGPIAPQAAADEGKTPAVGDGTAKDGDAKSAKSDAIEEVIITARKREENLQSTPIAVTAFAGADMDDLGVLRSDQVQKFVPNLLFSQSAGTQN